MMLKFVGAILPYAAPADLEQVFYRYQDADDKRPYWEWFHEFVVSVEEQSINESAPPANLTKAGVLQVLRDFGVEAFEDADGYLVAKINEENARKIREKLKYLLDQVLFESVEQAVQEKLVNEVNVQQNAIIETQMQRVEQALMAPPPPPYDDKDQDEEPTQAPPIPPRSPPRAPPPPPVQQILAQAKDNMKVQTSRVLSPLLQDEIQNHNQILKLKAVNRDDLDTGDKVKAAAEKNPMVAALAGALAKRRGGIASEEDYNNDAVDENEWDDDDVEARIIGNHVVTNVSRNIKRGLACYRCGRGLVGSPIQCRRCKRVRYCSVACGQRDWVIHGRAECDK